MKKELKELLIGMMAEKIIADDIEIAIEEGFDVLMSDDGDVLIVNDPHKNRKGRRKCRGRKNRQRMDNLKGRYLADMATYGLVEVQTFVHKNKDGSEVVLGSGKVKDYGDKHTEAGEKAWSRKVRHQHYSEPVEEVEAGAVFEEYKLYWQGDFVNTNASAKVGEGFSEQFKNDFKSYLDGRYLDLVNKIKRVDCEIRELECEYEALEEELAEHFGNKKWWKEV